MNYDSDFSKTYVRLRLLLDSLTVNTLRFCLDGNDTQAKIDRVNGIENDLLNLIKTVDGDPVEGVCDPGYFNCGGVCVPYACVENDMNQSAN